MLRWSVNHSVTGREQWKYTIDINGCVKSFGKENSEGGSSELCKSNYFHLVTYTEFVNQWISCLLEKIDPVHHVSQEDLIFTQKRSNHHSSSKREKPRGKEDRWPAQWFWYRSGSERLSNALPLSEDNVSRTSPLSRRRETILIGSAGTKDDFYPEYRISQK